VGGEDDETIREVCRLILEKHHDPSTTDFDLDVIDASQVSAGEIRSSVQREPVLGDVRFVVVQSCEVYRKREASKDVDLLVSTINKLTDRSCLVLTVKADQPTGRKPNSILTPKLDSAVREVGLVIQCPALRGDMLVRWVAQYVSQAGKQITREAAHLLSKRESTDRTSLTRELDKIIQYVGSRPCIEAADVQAVASHDPEDVIFKLLDAVSSRRTGEALTLLRIAAQYESKPQALAGRLLALLNRQFRLLYQARELRAVGVLPHQFGMLPEDLQQQLPSDASIVGMAWKGKALAHDADLWSRSELVRAFSLLVECDAANKGEETWLEDSLANLELLIVRLCDGSLEDHIRQNSP